MGFLRLEQMYRDIDLGLHTITEAALREIEIHATCELNHEYRFPEEIRRAMLVRDYLPE